MKNPLVVDGEHLPEPKGGMVCRFCDPPKYFESFNKLACHITIVHNENGRKRSFYGDKVPEEILNHEDWTGFEDEST